MSTAEKFDEGMIDHRSYVHNPNFCLLGVEDTGHVTIEHCLTNLLFFSLVLLSLFSYRDGSWEASDPPLFTTMTFFFF